MTDDTIIIERPAIAGAQFLPINLCRAAALNPRKRFDQAALDRLADNIDKVGVLQPVLARPIEGAKRGGVLYEIVAGERRLRACQILAKRRKELDVAVIPAVVRELTDFEALEIATTENLQREDVHPLEEAEGYEGLLMRPIHGGEFDPPRTRGYTVDELAERLGKSRGYVFGRLKLLSLIPEARNAFYDDKIAFSIALAIARMPASVQKEASKKIIQGWGGEPMSFRQARDMLEREFMLKLSEAPFKITDESLVPGAGNCRECPKRTGANPDLFDDIKSADVCTDPSCFAKKKEAHQARLIEQAKAEGREVILGKDAKKIAPHGTAFGLMKDYMRLDRVDYNVHGSKPLEKLLGKDTPPTALLEDPSTHDLVAVVKTSDAMKVLKDKGIVKSAKVPSRSASERAAEEKAKAEALWRQTLAERAIAEVVDPKYDDIDLHAWLLPEVAVAMWHRMDFDTTKRAAKLLGWGDVGRDDQADKKLRALSPSGLDQAFVAMAVAGQLHINHYNGNSKPDRLLQIAGRLGIDGAAVRAELAATKAAKAKKPAKKAAARKAPSPAAPDSGKGVKSKRSTSSARPVQAAAKSKPKTDPAAAKAAGTKSPSGAAKYRNAETGETWSGRGLQPAWLQAALASGRKLSEFDVPATASTRPVAQISNAAAWPFPTSPKGTSSPGD